MSFWDTRTVQLAALITPNTRVLEFGAGRMVLRRHLPEGCTYTPSDLVEREPGILCYDLNAPQLAPLPGFDVAVFGGVLEYVHDIPRLLTHLHGHCECVVASYAVATSKGLRARLGRRKHGWVNDYSAEGLVGMFLHAGFYPSAERRWGGQILYQFKKQHVHPAAVRDL
jgi:hypothetical protein